MERAISSYPWKNIEARDLFQKTSLVGREPKVLRSKIDDFLFFSGIGGSENEIIGGWKNQGGKYRPIYIRGIDSINQLVNRASKRSARLSRERTFLSLTLTVSITVWKLMGEEWRAWKGRVKSFRLNQGILIRPSGESFFFFFFTRNAIKTRPSFGSTSFRHAWLQGGVPYGRMMDRPSYLPPPTRWIIQIHQLTATISLRRMHATRLLVHRGNKNRGRVFAAYAFARKIAFTFTKNRFPPPLGFVSTSLCRFSFQRWAWILETGLLGGKGVAASWKV